MRTFTEKDLLQCLRKGEGPTIDFKHAVTNLEKIARAVAAFANSKGGYLIIGIDDNKDILGVKIETEKYQLNKAIQQFCSPTVPVQFHTINFRGAMILIAHIVESTSKPHFSINKKGAKKLYIRIQDNCVLADDLFAEYLLSGSLNNALQNYSIIQKITEEVRHTFGAKASLTVEDYAKLSGLDNAQATRRLLHLVLAGVLEKEVNQPVFKLYKDFQLKVA